MKKLIAAALLFLTPSLLWAQTPTGAMPRAQLQALIDSSFPTNNNNQITASTLRSFLTNFNNSTILWYDTTPADQNSATQDDVSYYALTGGTVGWFSTYNQKGNIRINLKQAEDQTAIKVGSFRDALFVNHVDGDGTNYTASGLQRVSFGVRSVVTGVLSGGNFVEQYKDLVGLSGTCIARISWSARGCSGITVEAIQYGNAIASNEFSAENPNAANAQASSMSAVQAILKPQKADVDGSHFAFAVSATNVEGYKASAGFYLASQAHGSDAARDGAFQVGLNMAGSKATDAGILMPACRSGSNACTIIGYDTNDWTDYLLNTNTYRWVIGGAVAMSLAATGPTFAMPTSAGAGGLYVCIDTAGVMYKKATCP